jgi:hypothetical protein
MNSKALSPGEFKKRLQRMGKRAQVLLDSLKAVPETPLVGLAHVHGRRAFRDGQIEPYLGIAVQEVTWANGTWVETGAEAFMKRVEADLRSLTSDSPDRY